MGVWEGQSLRCTLRLTNASSHAVTSAAVSITTAKVGAAGGRGGGHV